jgi:hypothetical protein
MAPANGIQLVRLRQHKWELLFQVIERDVLGPGAVKSRLTNREPLRGGAAFSDPDISPAIQRAERNGGRAADVIRQGGRRPCEAQAALWDMREQRDSGPNRTGSTDGSTETDCSIR